MSDFRPISCCNIMYKCISKILANRLKDVLPSIIDDAQSAFVPGRTISDNILIAQDLLRNYHRSSSPSRCSVRVDFFKAFYTVDWQFLFITLRELNFPQVFIDWIRECICSPKFSINLNGEMTGFFGSSRGLR